MRRQAGWISHKLWWDFISAITLLLSWCVCTRPSATIILNWPWVWCQMKHIRHHVYHITTMKQTVQERSGNLWVLCYQSVHLLMVILPLQWHHNDRDGISDHQCLHCLLNCWFRHRSKKTSKLCLTGLCAGNSLGTGEFPSLKAISSENVSIWWRHNGSTTVWLKGWYQTSILTEQSCPTPQQTAMFPVNNQSSKTKHL